MRIGSFLCISTYGIQSRLHKRRKTDADGNNMNTSLLDPLTNKKHIQIKYRPIDFIARTANKRGVSTLFGDFVT